MKSYEIFDSHTSLQTKARIVLNISIAVIISILFGRVMAPYFQNLSAITSGWYMLTLVGTGWILQIVLINIINKYQFSAYVLKLSQIMVVGVCILLPVIIVHLFNSNVWCLYHTISVIISLSTMLVLHIRLIKALQMNWLFTLSWLGFLLLSSGAGLLMLINAHPIL